MILQKSRTPKTLRFFAYTLSGVSMLGLFGFSLYAQQNEITARETKLDIARQLAANEREHERYCAENPKSADYFAYRIAPTERLYREDLQLVHPILHVKAGQMPSQNSLGKVDYKQLHNFAPDVDAASFERSFYAAEVAAAEYFCKIAKGKSQSELTELVGAPDYLCNKVVCWDALNPGQERWIYDFGFAEVPVKVLFDGGVCKVATICGDNEFSDYLQWRMFEITKNSLGQSINVIVARNGNPDRLSDVASPNTLHVVHQATELVHYKICKSSELVLVMRNGICTNVHMYARFH